MAQRPRNSGFSRRAQTGLFIGYVVAVAGVIVAALLLALSVFDPRTFGAVRTAASEITTPISTGAAALARGVSGIGGGIADYFAVKGRNASLRQQIEDERALVVRARAIVFENRRLKALLHVREGTVDAVVAARIVSSTGSSTRRYAIINAGFRQGVAPGQGVRGVEGLIGRVVEAGPDSARILLVSDSESVVPVRRERDGAPALAAGRGDGFIEIRSVGAGDPAFRQGDRYVTSGTGGLYVPNIPVARVLHDARDTAVARGLAEPEAFDYAIVQKAFVPLVPAPDASAPAAAH